MTSRRPPRNSGRRLLLGLARVLATVAIAVPASAMLAELNLRAFYFPRILPVIATGEGILYVLILGGGQVAGPVLLLTVALAFVFRFGIALAAAALAPQSGDLIAGAQYYWASYWPAALVQILLVGLMLRLIKPLIARRRGPRLPTSPERGQPPTDPEPEPQDEERRELLLAALGESPEKPPESITALEEMQIGDLAKMAEIEIEADEEAQELALPFGEGEEEEEEPEAFEEPAEVATEADEGLPPGVVDATPGARVEQGSEAAAEAVERSVPETAEAESEKQTAAAGVETAESEVPAHGIDDTAPLDPVSPRPDQLPELGRVETPENLREMVDVIAGATGAGSDVRVWATPEGRTVIAAVPSGTPAAGTARQAAAVVRARLALGSWLQAEPDELLTVGARLGAWALRGLDPEGAIMLLLAAKGPTSAGRLEMTAGRLAEALAGLVEPGEVGGQGADAAERDLEPDADLAAVIAEAAAGSPGLGAWECYRDAAGLPVAVSVPPGGDSLRLAEAAVEMARSAEAFTDAIALGSPRWSALASRRARLVAQWATLGDRRLLLVAASNAFSSAGRLRWELQRIARATGAEEE